MKLEDQNLTLLNSVLRRYHMKCKVIHDERAPLPYLLITNQLGAPIVKITSMNNIAEVIKFKLSAHLNAPNFYLRWSEEEIEFYKAHIDYDSYDIQSVLFYRTLSSIRNKKLALKRPERYRSQCQRHKVVEEISAPDLNKVFGRNVIIPSDADREVNYNAV